ncbi:uncharacterized protein LOC123676292 isoform X2 [Harmonia axyridis]|uniref:uncharacterized protein LOC123676292 isoform X2 n=1 Tax=Harmonia axyridis TaxID=115357 RepID=UPI001E275D0A|nr:uncharacterized protein LOC123676292 isoform X2 [Harmonia axyridis]
MSFLDDKQTTMGYGKENIAKITKHRNTGRNQEEDFVEVNRGRKRRFKNPEKNIGTGQQNKGISGQERKVWLYIYRVNRNTTTNMIEDYILTKEGFDKQTIMVKEIPSEENSLKRFVLTAPIAKKDEMYKPEFWPSGVGIKRFSFSKHKEFTQQGKDFFITKETQLSELHTPTKNTKTNDKKVDKKQNLTLTHLNIQSLSTSLNGLEIFVNENKIDFLALTENWQSYEQLMAYKLNGFNLITSFCREINRHGGCAIYVREQLHNKCKKRKEMDKFNVPRVIECTALEYEGNNHIKLIIICIYRPNTHPFENVDIFFEKMNLILKTLTIRTKNIKFMITGDFNIDMLNQQDKNTQTMTSILEMYNLKPLVIKPTRITPTSKTCIDNIFSNIEDETVTILQPHLSDHLAITCRFNMIEDVTTKYKIITKHNVNEQSLEKFGIELSTVDWSELYQITDNEVDGISTSFTVIFSSEGSPELYEENGIYFVLSRFKASQDSAWYWTTVSSAKLMMFPSFF